MIRLLPIPRRAWLTAFGMVASGCLLLSGTFVGWHQQSLELAGTSLILAIGLAACAVSNPALWTVPYRAWNSFARRIVNGARLYVLALCYMVVTAAGFGIRSNRFMRNSESGSGWLPHQEAFPSDTDGSTVKKRGGVAPRNWKTDYVMWARATGDPLKIGILPFLVLLSILDYSEDIDVPTTTYTLF